VIDYVLDSFALTAFVQNEPGGVRVQELFFETQRGETRLAMTVVNLGEVLYIAYRRGGPPRFVDILNLIPDLPVEIVGVDMSLAVTASRLKAVLPIAYGDCFAGALAIERKATVVTGDPEFRRLAHIVPIDWLPEPR
jgi:ribonuclease VapC